MSGPEFIDAKTAIAALPKRGPIHCQASFTGANWDRKSVAALLKRAVKIAWAESIFKHELAVWPAEDSGWTCILRFDVQRPSRS
jgi:hypothetical protein